MSRIQLALVMMGFTVFTFASPAMAVRSTSIHLPGPGYQVEYSAFSKFCPQGTPCDHQIVTAGADSTVLVPQLLQLTNTTYTWYDQINIKILPENGAAHIDDQGDLAPMIVLRPADTVADRDLDRTPVCNPYWVDMLNERWANRQFWIEYYGVWTGSIKIHLETDAAKGPAFNSGRNEMIMPADPAWFSKGHPSLTYVIGHEMTHYAQTLAGHPVGEGISHFHDGCMTASAEGSFGEGMAGAIGQEYALWRRGGDPDVDYVPCWKLTYWYEKSSVLGLQYEDNNGAFIRSLTKRDRRKFWEIFTTARVTLPTGTTRPIRDAAELLAACSKRTDILPDRWVIKGDPTAFPEVDSLFQYWINGVEPAVLALHTGDSNKAGGWEYDSHFWIRKVYPNPTVGMFYLDVHAPSSGTIGVKLYSVSGRLVHTQTFTGLAIGEYRLMITPPHLPSGKYYIKYVDPWGLVTASDKVTLLK